MKYLNNIVEQDHRAIKRRTRPMLGFKDFRRARILLGGMEVMHMIVKGQMKCAHGIEPFRCRSILLVERISNPNHIDVFSFSVLIARRPTDVAASGNGFRLR
jgi:hypothetical protein